MKVTILKHEKSKAGYFFKHKALVEIEGVTDFAEEKGDILNQVSIKVGYHPLGYGIYGGKIVKSAKEGQYIVNWDTGTSAD
jgi:hypothetical protein